MMMNAATRIIIGPKIEILDGERFLIKARDFKNATGLSEGLSLKFSQIITVSSSVFFVIILWFLYKTKTGKSMRAYSDNEDLALLSGINPERVVVCLDYCNNITGSRGTLYGLDKGFKPLFIICYYCQVFPRQS